MSLTPLILLAESVEGDAVTSADFLTLLFVLMLATFIGLEVVKNVSRLLHTPLMSLTNAISAIAVVGSILLAGQVSSGENPGVDQPVIITIMGTVALAASMTNIVSGFLITDRMLKRFKKREPGKS